MFGINGFEMVILVLVALFVIGPQRLPEYAAKLRDVVRSFRRMAEGAKETVKKDFGADLDEYDWRSLDPRQYDPRRIVREALAEEDRAIREEQFRAGRDTGSPAAGSTTGARSSTHSTVGSSAGGPSTGPSRASGGSGAPDRSDAATSAAEAAATRLTPMERHRDQVGQRQDGQGAPFDPEAT
ncbi:sec-independent protein translocase protein TatB [Brevibacterium sp. Mu109]|uniref:twin-arginine translocase TatA/TatE family subunit n=1 Tax=Brevibacterium sp. Mu109 TaxID=1255669 RepID=UPI000C461F22|nr:twin-arginine translocase TatA/TatE family subunit [Brevibacterium sp. Mu109]SMX75470.1 sec-independent protein translocase protein TatB [Brevibacterium sp. Mu109]